MEPVRRICVSAHEELWYTDPITCWRITTEFSVTANESVISGKACHEMWLQALLNVLWLIQKKPEKELDVKDSIVVTCIHHHRDIMIPDLLPSQSSQSHLGKLLS